MATASPLLAPSKAALRPSGRDLDALEEARPSPFVAPIKSDSDLKSNIRPRRPLRVAIVTENFLPKIDGVTRTLAMLLEHLQAEGHEAMVLGPATPLVRIGVKIAHFRLAADSDFRNQKTYAGAEVVATKGIPLLGVYRGLGLNFLRPRFIRKLRASGLPRLFAHVSPLTGTILQASSSRM